MRHLICGIDGYIGWSLALHLANEGHEVYGIDNLSRRKNVEEVGSWSATPIPSMAERVRIARNIFGVEIRFFQGDLLEYPFISEVIKKSNPDAIFHLGEQPSAPYSMISRENAVYTQENNVIGNLNLLFAMKEFASDSHLIKLGSMGEYGTPNIDIPEGFFEVRFRGRKDKLPFPKQPGSFYHLSKVHDTHNIMLACKLWGLRATDIMQGVVYGTRTQEIIDDGFLTRFDFDEVFGTALNRFCAEAVVGHPLTPYGSGKQTRGFLALIDSVQCLTLISENPPGKGDYRVLNQLDKLYSVHQLANIVRREGERLGLKIKIENTENPRVESPQHYYKVDHKGLKKLGFKPTRPIEDEIRIMLEDLMRFRGRISQKIDRIKPRVSWKEGMPKIQEETTPNYVAWCERQ